MSSLTLLVVPSHFFSWAATILPWIPSSSIQSIIKSISGMSACGYHMQVCCGRLGIQLCSWKQWHLQYLAVLFARPIVAVEVWEVVKHMIQHYDVIPLLHDVFVTTLSWVEINQQASADSGRRPLNNMLVEHPSLHSENMGQDAYSHFAYDISVLNIENADDMTASVLNKILTERVKNKAA